MTKEECWKVNADGEEVRQLRTLNRWTGSLHGWDRAWFVASGYLAWEVKYQDGRRIQTTDWKPSGAVKRQIQWTKGGRLEFRELSAPPWLWGVTDQTEPTAPWWGKE